MANMAKDKSSPLIFCNKEIKFTKDIELLSSLLPERLKQFEAWFVQLEQESFNRDNPYGGSLIENTGIDCWFHYFDSETTPAETIKEDLSYAY